MKDSLTICEACDLVHGQTREPGRPWNWRCMAKPVRPGFGFVSTSYSPDPPYGRCQEKNLHGDCPDFKPLREAGNAIG